MRVVHIRFGRERIKSSLLNLRHRFFYSYFSVSTAHAFSQQVVGREVSSILAEFRAKQKKTNTEIVCS